MADEDIEAYEAYLAEQAFQDQYAAEMEAMDELEAMSTPNDPIGSNSKEAEDRPKDPNEFDLGNFFLNYLF